MRAVGAFPETNITGPGILIAFSILTEALVMPLFSASFATSPSAIKQHAFAPYRSIVDDLAYQYLLFGQTKENEDGMPASGDLSRVTTIGEIMKNRKLI